jgi:hypothetical protein
MTALRADIIRTLPAIELFEEGVEAHRRLLISYFPSYDFRNGSGNFAKLTAIRRASYRLAHAVRLPKFCLVSTLATRPHSGIETSLRL